MGKELDGNELEGGVLGKAFEGSELEGKEFEGKGGDNALEGPGCMESKVFDWLIESGVELFSGDTVSELGTNDSSFPKLGVIVSTFPSGFIKSGCTNP